MNLRLFLASGHIPVCTLSCKNVQVLMYWHCSCVIQIHWPIRTKPGAQGFSAENMLPLCLPKTWAAMEDLYASRQARAIGVSNFSSKKLQNLLQYAKVPPAVNQVECHLAWQQPALHNLCKSTGIHLSVRILSQISILPYAKFAWFQFMPCGLFFSKTDAQKGCWMTDTLELPL